MIQINNLIKYVFTSIFILVFSLFGFGQSLFIVDNNINNNLHTNLEGYCDLGTFTYEVYWNDTSGLVTNVDIVNNSNVILATGSVSPITVTIPSNTSTANLSIRVRESSDTINISTASIVKRKNCSMFGSSTAYNSSGTFTYTAPTYSQFVRFEVIGGGGSGRKRNQTTSSAKPGGGGGGYAKGDLLVQNTNEDFRITVAGTATSSSASNGKESKIKRSSNLTVSLIRATGGKKAGATAGGNGGTGIFTGTVSNTISFKGGKGASRSNSSSGPGGGGGGAAHPGGNGNNGNASGTGGNSSSPGGKGGNSNGKNGANAGGGGAGRNSSSTGNAGNGARGWARATPIFDIIKPTVTINEKPLAVNTYTVVFSEPIQVGLFTTADINITSVNNLITINSLYEVSPNDGTTFEIKLNKFIDDTVTAIIPEASVYDIAGNINNASTSIDNVIIQVPGPGNVSNNISLWLKSDEGTSTILDGTPLTQWDDITSNNNNALESINPPNFKNNTTDNINYNPVVEFNGIANKMDLNPILLPTGSTARTYFAVGIPTKTGFDNPIIEHGSNNNGKKSSLNIATDRIAHLYKGRKIYFNHNENGPLLASSHYTQGQPAKTTNLRMNGIDVAQSTINGGQVINTNTTLAHIGKFVSSSTFYGGTIAEVIVFERNLELTLGDINKVETYLGIKYGITLAHDYVNSSGSIIWDSTAMLTYRNDIAGIGLDSCGTLNQKQSKSINTDAIVTMGLDSIATTNQDHGSSFVSDTSFLLWGNDNAPLAWTDTNLFSTKGMKRLARTWKISETNSIDSVEINISDTNLPFIPNGAKVYLMVSKSGNFKISPYYGYDMEYDNINNMYKVKHNFVDGDYFTFVYSFGAGSRMRHGKKFIFSKEEPYNTER